MSESVARKAPPRLPGWVSRAARAAAPLLPVGPALVAAEAVADRAPPKIRQKVANVALSDQWSKVASTPRTTARGWADLRSPSKGARAPGLHLLNPVGLSLEAQRRSGSVVAQVARSSAEWLEQRANDSGRSPYLKLGLGRLTGVLDGVGSAAEGGASLADWQIGLMSGDPETYRGALKTAQTGLYLEGELKERAGKALEESPIPGVSMLGRLTRQAGAVEKKLGGGDPTGERIRQGARGARELLKDKLQALRSNPVFEGGRLWGRLDFEMAVAAVPAGEAGKVGTAGRGLQKLERPWPTVISEPIVSRGAGGLRRSPFFELDGQTMARIEKEFEEIGGDPSVLRFNEGKQTGYVDSADVIRVRGDILPQEGALHPRSIMSSRAVMAHEWTHRRYRGTPLAPGAWNDEFRASYMAAKDCPGLTEIERMHLIQDAVLRAQEAGVPIRHNAFMRRTLYGY